MSKALLNQRFIYKINSSHLKRNKWDLEINDISSAIKNRFIISIGDSNGLRIIRKIDKSIYTEEYLNKIKSEIKYLKKHTKSQKEDKKKMKKLINNKQNAMLESNICNVVFDSDKHYDKLSEDGFILNGCKYVLLLGTAGGIKANTVMFCKESIYEELWKKLLNGADQSIPMIPSKLMAYISLAFSSSTPVTTPKRVLVVRDSLTHFKSDVTNIVFDEELGRPNVSLIKDFDVEVSANDGCSIATPELMKQWGEDLELDYRLVSCCIRNSYVKGMISDFSFKEYVKYRGWGRIVTDVWGKEHNINDIDLILNESMLKCWKSYSSIDDYMNKCKQNGFGFAVTKAVPKELDNERMLNYQYVQCLNLSDDDIKQLAKKDIDEVKDVLGLDYRKSIIFGKGSELTVENVWNKSDDDLHIKALMIEPKAINDEYVKQRIKKSIRKRIEMMKTGKINVNGNYQISIGEPIIQLESMFIPNEVKGILNSGEFHIEYWRRKNVDMVGAFRSPQSCKENARKFIISKSDEAIRWYGHLFGVIIFNAWDTTMMAMNGQDMDGDLDYTTSNEIVINGIYELPAINCQGNSASKISNIEKSQYVEAIKKSFGNKVGSVTNYGSSCYDKISLFDNNTRQYDEIDYRMKCIQFYQQECIDSAKNGIPPKPIPKYWHDFRAKEIKYNLDLETGEILDSIEEYSKKEFLNSVLTEKKPYFFRYIYDDVNKEYVNFNDKTESNCARRFRCKVEDLKSKEHLTTEQSDFLKWYDIKNPLSLNPCIVNKLAWIIEENFDDLGRVSNVEFDSSIYMDKSLDIIIGTSTNKSIKSICESYKKSIQAQYNNSDFNDKTNLQKVKDDAIDKLNDELSLIIPNSKVLANTLIHLAYIKGSIPKFVVWLVSGNQILDNMLNNNNRSINFPIQNTDGDLLYGGRTFKMINKEINTNKEM